MSEPRPRPSHLIDLNAPRPTAEERAADKARLERVQRWVMSSLVVITLMHFSGGLVLAAMFLNDPTTGAKIGLCILAGVLTSLSVAIALAIHKRNMVSPWLGLGLVTTAIGLWLTLS